MIVVQKINSYWKTLLLLGVLLLIVPLGIVIRYDLKGQALEKFAFDCAGLGATIIFIAVAAKFHRAWKNISIAVLLLSVVVLVRVAEKIPVVSSGMSCSGPYWNKHELVFEGYRDEYKGLSYQMLSTIQIYYNGINIECHITDTGVSRDTITLPQGLTTNVCRIVSFDPQNKTAVIDDRGLVYRVNGEKMTWEVRVRGATGQFIAPCKW